MPLVTTSFWKYSKICNTLFKCPNIYKNITRSFSEAQNEKKGIILGFYETESHEPLFTPAAQRFNDNVGGKLFDLVKESESEVSRGRTKTFSNICKEYWSVAIVGLGRDNLGFNATEALDMKLEAIRIGAGVGARKLHAQGCTRILVEGLGGPEQAAEGTALALWKYQENKSRDDWSVIPSLELYDEPDVEAWQRGLFKAESQNLARRLSDTPANQMTPLHFAQETVNELCPCGIKVEVHDRDWIERKKMYAFLTVARGSCEPPVLIDITYCGGPQEQKPILLVGKGITFDSGGVCLKPRGKFLKFRGSMTGAAAIVGCIRACNALSLPININAVLPLCENMPSGMAMKVGDMVRALNGKSICIQDTDKESRVVLADALVYAQKTFKPKLVITVGDFTNGAKKAFGTPVTAVFSNSQTMWGQARKAGIISGDRVWRLPLWKYYTRMVTDFYSHDVDNVGIGYGDCCLAAAFLNEFIDCVDWIHYDTTGTGLLADDKTLTYLSKGRMTGRPTRALIQLLYQLACPNQKPKC